MIQLDEAKQKLTKINALATQAGTALGLEDLQKELGELRTSMEQPGFWDNVKQANKVNKKIKPIEDKLNQFDKISGRLSDAAVMLELIEDDYDDVVCAVVADHRKKIKYSCAPCKPDLERPPLPCW